MGLVDLLGERTFWDAFKISVLASLVVVTIALVWRFRSPVPLAGVAGAIAALIGVHRALGLPEDLVTGIAVLGVGGVAGRFFGSNPLIRSLTAAPGAVLLADAVGSSDVGWLRPFVVVATMAGAALVSDFDQRHARSGLGPVLMAVTAFGVYVTVPDTERALVLVGAFLPIALLGWPRVVASLGVAGSYAAVGMTVWTAAVDGQGRLGSIIGATACLGVLVLEPLLQRIAPGSGVDRFPSRSWFLLAGAHIALVAICARVAGAEDSPTRAALIAVVAFGVTALAVSFGERTGSRPAT